MCFSTGASPCACDSLVGINLSLGLSPLRSSEVIFSKKSVLAGVSYWNVLDGYRREYEHTWSPFNGQSLCLDV